VKRRGQGLFLGGPVGERVPALGGDEEGGAYLGGSRPRASPPGTAHESVIGCDILDLVFPMFKDYF
jgi:hypothetical protein